MVVHGTNGSAAGTISDGKGGQLCSYSFKKEDKGLVFEAAVNRKDLVFSTNNQWPWGNGDALTLYLDLRDKAHLGGLGFDGNVYQIWFRPEEKPYFSPGFHPWSGKHMASIATPYGEQTADGYKVGLKIAGFFNIHEPVDLSDRDFLGFDLSVFYPEPDGKQTSIGEQTPDRRNFIFPGAFAMVDLNNTLTGDSTFTASVFPDGP
jgi:hypothetical protein